MPGKLRIPRARCARYAVRAGGRSACLFLIVACCAQAGGDALPEPCTDAWNSYVDRLLVTGDGQGHGPDRGSDEWKGVIEFRLGIRGKPGIPARDSDEWCRYVDSLVRER